jgi:uncharacterized glyoxalase superfamily protein PhnB
MKKPPEGWPRISPALFYDEAGEAIDFLCRAFGFEVRLKVEGEGGRIEHSELVFGEGLIMVASAKGKDEKKTTCLSPRSTGGVNTQSLCVAVEDADAHCARSRAAGAKITTEPSTTDYGEGYWADRTYEAVDPEGHRWWFMQRVRDPLPGARK